MTVTVGIQFRCPDIGTDLIIQEIANLAAVPFTCILFGTLLRTFTAGFCYLVCIRKREMAVEKGNSPAGRKFSFFADVFQEKLHSWNGQFGVADKRNVISSHNDLPV